MDFEYSDKVRNLQQQIRRFMAEHVLPNESTHSAQLAESPWATPPIVEDVSYRILAVKLHDGVRHEAWLHGAIAIEEGIDISLTARIRLAESAVEVLDGSIDNPQPSKRMCCGLHRNILIPKTTFLLSLQTRKK